MLIQNALPHQGRAVCLKPLPPQPKRAETARPTITLPIKGRAVCLKPLPPQPKRAGTARPTITHPTDKYALTTNSRFQKNPVNLVNPV